MSDATTSVYLLVEFNLSFFCVRGVYSSLEQAHTARVAHVARRQPAHGSDLCIFKSVLNTASDLVFLSDQGSGYSEVLAQRNTECVAS